MRDRTRRAVQAQIEAMGCETFEVGLFKPDALPGEAVMLPRVWDVDTLLRSVPWLRKENREGRNIFCRPKGEHGLSLVDDLSSFAVMKMKRTGFQPAVLVETSPNNFQAWLNHGRPLPKTLSTIIAKELAAKFGGDTGAADWRHFGRLAGFTNRKDKYRYENTGLFPFVRLIENGSTPYDEAAAFVEFAERRLAVQTEERTKASRHLTNATRPSLQLKGIETFRADDRYAGDGTRIDLAYAIYGIAHGLGLAKIESAIKSRDLSHKGTEKRQNDYVERTIQKALSALQGSLQERGR